MMQRHSGLTFSKQSSDCCQLNPTYLMMLWKVNADFTIDTEVALMLASLTRTMFQGKDS